jgi:hypothetical protein
MITKRRFAFLIAGLALAASSAGASADMLPYPRERRDPPRPPPEPPKPSDPQTPPDPQTPAPSPK